MATSTIPRFLTDGDIQVSDGSASSGDTITVTFAGQTTGFLSFASSNAGWRGLYAVDGRGTVNPNYARLVGGDISGAVTATTGKLTIIAGATVVVKTFALTGEMNVSVTSSP